MKPKAFCIPALSLLLVHTALAVDVTSTWDGGGSVTTWTGAANWTTDIAPAFGNNQVLVFTGALRTTNAIAADRVVKSILFDANADTAFSIRLRNNTAATDVGRVLTFQSDTGSSLLSMDADAAANHFIGSSTVTAPGTAGSIVLSNALNVVQNSTTNTLTLGDNPTVISGGAGAVINKSGAGVFILGGANTFTDAVYVNAGTLRLGSNGALGSNVSGTFVADGATLDVAALKVGTSGENVSIAGSGVGGAGAFLSSTGNIAAGSPGINLILTANATVGVTGARNGVTSSTISSGGMNYTLTKVGTGQFDTEGSTVNVGPIVVSSGIFQTALAATFNTGFPLTVNTGAEFRMFELATPFPRNITLNAATINDTGSVNVTGDFIAGNITLGGSGTFKSGGDATDMLTVTGNIGESSAGSTLEVNGARTVQLSGTNSYTGLTTVTTGTLKATGTFASPISVAAGATLSGEGSTSGTLSLADGANLTFDPSTTGTNQFLRANSVTAAGTVIVNPSALASGSNIVVLQTTTGTLDLNQFLLPFGTLGELSLGAGGTQLLYTNTGANLEWRALVDNSWSEFGPNNFQNLSTNSPAAFTAGDNVNFANVGTGTVSLASNVTAGIVNFNNTTGNNFTILPAGAETLTAVSINPTSTGDVTIASAIAGTTKINKTGAGKLVLSGANTFSGTLTNSAGTLQLGDGVTATTGLATTSVVNNGTFDIKIGGGGAVTVTIPSAITGSGNLVQSGSEITVLTGANNYSGTTTVNSGTLRFAKPTSLYGGNSANWTPSKITVNSGGILAFEINGAGFTTADVTTLITNLVNGPVAAYKAGSTLALNANGDATIADVIGNSTGTGGGSLGLLKGGAAVLTLTGNNTFTGGLTVNNGTLIAGDANIGTGTVTLGAFGPNNNMWQLTGSTDNPINFSNIGTGTKVINLATGVTDATLSGTITLAADGAPGTNGVSRINTVTGTIFITGKMTGTGTGGYAKRNIGTVVITNPNNDYTGPTTIVDAGTLLVDGKVSSANTYFGPNIDGSGTGAANGILGGSGILTGNVTTKAGSFISPGGTSAAGVTTETIATLTIGGTLDVAVSAAGTGKLIYQLGTPATSDKLAVGALAIGTDVLGFSDFTFTGVSGFGPGTYMLITSGAPVSGTLNPADLTGTIGTQTATLSISGNNLVLTVGSTSTPFQSWFSTYYPGITAPNNDPAADFDNDGTSNFGEFAFGGAPDSGTSAGPRRTAVDNIGGTDYLTLTIATRSGTTFTGSAPATATRDGVTYTVEGSVDLTGFSQPVTEMTPAITTGLPTLGTGPLTDYEYHTFRLTAPRTASATGFLRATAKP